MRAYVGELRRVALVRATPAPAGCRPRLQARPFCRSGEAEWLSRIDLVILLFPLLELVDGATYSVNRFLNELSCV